MGGGVDKRRGRGKRELEGKGGAKGNKGNRQEQWGREGREKGRVCLEGTRVTLKTSNER